MRIISWNVNGIRAVHRKGDWSDFLARTPFDALILNETKAEEGQLTAEIKEIPGLSAYFSSSKVKKGYSGVALYTKKEPACVSRGMGTIRFDDEGRFIEADYGSYIIIGCYFPNGGGGPERLAYKLDFYDAFLEYLEKRRAEGKSIIFCGDVNTAHEEIDLARAKENEKNTGFLPEERAWLDEVVAHGYVDTFRHFHPNKKDAYSYWDMKTRARDRNVGWRIDYIFTSGDLTPKLKKAEILDTIYGSDHCPIALTVDI